MTTKSLVRPIAGVVLFLLVGGAGPCDQRVDLNQTSSPCGGKCTSAQICVHYPDCTGGAGADDCEDRTTSDTELCANYTGDGGSYTVDANQTLVTCVCPPASSADAGSPNGDGATDMAKAPCGTQSCASDEVCVNYPACTTGGSQTQSCEPTTMSFADDCANYGGHYTVDSTQSIVTCVCQ
ncbi:MAG TPA: hypothetical protein VHB97_21995 [Polyangia bacterium]|nr:hypothetical protein [Polyangia bacterium]